MTQRADDEPSMEPTRPVASLVSSVSSQTAAMFPAFAVGALALPMGDDLGFSEAGLGTAVACFFLLAAVTSPHAGTLTDRLGPQRSLRLANICSGAALVGIAVAVHSYWVLLAVLAVGAIGLTIAGPGTKTMVARGTDVARHGLFFGIQASAVPLSVFLAGLAVPLIGQTLGWRWAFGLAVAVPLTSLLAAPRYGPRPGHTVRAAGAGRGLSEIDYGPLWLIGLAAALGSAAATTLAAFFVPAATEAGLDEGLAGALLAVGGSLPIATRIIAGYAADRFESGHLRVVSLLLGTSTLGYAAAATGSKVLVPAGAMFAFAVGWAWSGLMVHSVVRAYRHAPGAATGITSGGLNVGGVFGPFVFGLLAERVSYASAFVMIAACALLAGLAADAGRRRLIRAGANP